jgi:hypothetical protein
MLTTAFLGGLQQIVRYLGDLGPRRGGSHSTVGIFRLYMLSPICLGNLDSVGVADQKDTRQGRHSVARPEECILLGRCITMLDVLELQQSEASVPVFHVIPITTCCAPRSAERGNQSGATTVWL